MRPGFQTGYNSQKQIFPSLATEVCVGGDVCVRQTEFCPALLPFIDFQLSNSRYEHLVVALAENTSPNSPDHHQLTRMFLLCQNSWQEAAYPFLVVTSNNTWYASIFH